MNLAAWLRAPVMSMGVVLGLFVVQAGGHLAFVFSLTGPADPVRVCLHFLTFLFYTAATMGCVLIYAVMIYDGTGVENQVRQMPDRAWEARCSGLFDRSSRMFAFVLTGVPWQRTGIRIGLEILALGSMFLSRDMRMLKDVGLMDACTLITGILVFFLLLGVVELPFLWIGFWRQKEINRRRLTRNHTRMRFRGCRQGVRPLTAPAWRPGRENDPLEMLGVWADTWLALETHVPGNPRFAALLGECVFRINLFNAALEKKWQTMPGRLDDGNDYPAYARYLEFHTNRVISGVSGIRTCLFDQVFPKIGGFPFACVNEQVLELGQALWQGPVTGTRHFKGYPFYLAEYCYLLGLLHAAVKEPFADTGVFLAFAYDPVRFSRLKGRLGAMLRTVDSEYALRRFIHQVRPVLLSAHLKDAGVSLVPGYELSPARICRQFVHMSRTTPVLLEPLTWHLAGVLAAVDAGLENSLEYETRQIQASGQQPLVDLVCRFTRQALDLFERMYGRPGKEGDAGGRLLFDEWFDLENRFLTQWRDLVDPVRGKPPHTIEWVTRQMNRKVADWPAETLRITGRVQKNGETGGDGGYQAVPETAPDAWSRFFSPKGHVLEQVIETLPLRQMDTLLRRYAHLGEIHHARLPDLLIGIGGTGTFLAHLVNYFRQTDAPVCSFLISPDIRCQPESVRLVPSDLTGRTDRAVICAGSVKTFFTFALLEACLQRHQHGPGIMEIWPFFFWEGHETVEIRTVPEIRPLFTVADVRTTLHPPASPFRSRCPSVAAWPGPGPEPPGNGRRDGLAGGLSECLVVDDSSCPVRIDYARLMADTRATASLALAFAGQIREMVGRTRGPAYLFSPSPAGRVLALGTGCFLRHMGVRVRFVTSRQAAAEAEDHGRSHTFLIDLSRVTGFTAGHAWQALTHQPWDRPIDIDDLMHPVLLSDNIRGPG